jgi:hypothetical protein
VTVNFGEQDFVLGETTLPQFGFLIESPGYVAFHATRRGAIDYPGGALFTLRAEGSPTLSRAAKVRVFHGFGPAAVEVAGRRCEVPREAWIDRTRER